MLGGAPEALRKKLNRAVERVIRELDSENSRPSHKPVLPPEAVKKPGRREATGRGPEPKPGIRSACAARTC
jgi:hypothetical protein